MIGSYASDDRRTTGTITGNVAGRALVYRWNEGGASGSGKFTLGAGGSSFAGWWNAGDDLNVAQNGWNGRRAMISP